MGLSAHEQRVLETIEDRLAGSDPGLALKLATFSRLNADGGSPVRERIGVARQWVTRRPPRSRRGQGRGRTCRRARSAASGCAGDWPLHCYGSLCPSR